MLIVTGSTTKDMKINTKGNYSIAEGKFNGTMESLGQYQCPEWFRDAKFGIWSHWGPQSVPMYGDWYARKMYLEESDEYRYHCRKYGHPSKFGYKDLIPLWKAEQFEPEKLMSLFVDAGAKYFVAQAMHHDNFDNFDSTYQPRFNSVVMGPNKDIVGEWQAAAQKYHLPFGISEHLAGSPGFFHAAKGCDITGKYKGVPYDGNDPEYFDLYFDDTNVDMAWEKNWFCSKEEFHKHWFLRMKDVIDRYKPDLVYTDGPVPCGQYGLDIVAHLYNVNAKEHGGENQGVFNQKNSEQNFIKATVLDIECSREDNITPYCWQTDTSIGDWFYNLRDIYKPWNVIVEMLIDIVSKNGNLLLDITQLPDGRIDEECEWILHKIAEWMKVNGEGIFGTRPFRISGEGVSVFKKEEAYDEHVIDWKSGDVRFTVGGQFIYGYFMRWPGTMAIIKSLPLGKEKVYKVELLGYGMVDFKQTGAGLILSLPNAAPSELISCIKITT